MTRLLIGLLLGACGSHTTPPRPAPVPADAPPPVEPAPTDTECDALIDHAIDLQAPKGNDAGVGSDDRSKLRGEVRDRVMTRCHAMPRATYRCAMAATTIDAFTGCE